MTRLRADSVVWVLANVVMLLAFFFCTPPPKPLPAETSPPTPVLENIDEQTAEASAMFAARYQYYKDRMNVSRR